MPPKNYHLFNFTNLSIKLKLAFPLALLVSIAFIQTLIWLFGTTHNQISNWFILLVFANLIILTVFWIALQHYLFNPLIHLADASLLISKGKLDTELEIKSLDELGSIAIATENLADSIRKAREFTKSIGEGNYNFNNLEIHNNGHDDSLFISLLSMRNQLKESAESDNKRNWTAKGMAEFTEILRTNFTDIQKLSQRIINGIVRYLEASQGAVFVLNDEDNKNIFLEMTACYAYKEEDFKQKKVIIENDFGEGLVGQAYLEKEIIYLTEVPTEYMQIASGLGEGDARSILIVPLELNGKIEGVIEIATLNQFEQYKIDFVKRLAENIASAILSLKVNEHTKKLLRESQELTQKLQAQEEEMRKNYEELQATQDMVENKNKLIEVQKQEIQKALEEQSEINETLLAQEEEMRQNMEELVATQEQMKATQLELDGQLNAINNSTVCKVELDLEGKIISANSSFCRLVKYDLQDIKGLSETVFLDSESVEMIDYQEAWQRLQKGISYMGDFIRVDKEQEKFWINAVYSPVFNKKGEVYKVILLAFDITEAKIKAKEVESKNQLITSSIKYAKNIQSAILPDIEMMKKVVKDVFVIYLPKDIVSGDFYWFSHKENKLFFAVVDCTGHGVPGAFMSIIGNTLLNEIVNVQEIFDTNRVLEMLHEGVRNKLRQAESTNQDGMDLVFCMVEYLKNNKVKVSFSGAKRSLYYIKHQNPTQLIELKGDRKSIGGWQQESYRTFESQEVILDKEDLLYLTTDGIMDNPNNERKKFGFKRFKEMLLSNAHEDFETQRRMIFDNIKTFQVEESQQRDDISMLGIKL